MGSIVRVANVRMVYDGLYEASGYQGSTENESYTAKFLIEKGSENDNAIKAVIKEVADEAFKKQADKVLKTIEGNNMKFPYMDGDLSKYESNEGHMILTAKRKKSDGQPMVQDKDGCRLKERDRTALKAGDYVYASIEFYAQSGANEAIRCVLRAVRFCKEGAAVGGGVAVTEDEFADLIVPEDNAAEGLV